MLRLFVTLLLMLVWLGWASTPIYAESHDNNIQLVAVQMTLDLNDYWTDDSFADKVKSIMNSVSNKIAEDVPTLVVFPEDVGLMLVVQGMQQRLANVKSIKVGIEQATRANIIPVLWNRFRHGLSWVPSLFLYKHQVIAKSYFEVFSQAAKDHNVYLVAGSVILPPYNIEDGIVQWQKPLNAEVYNTSYLFGPDGKVIGKQDKVHLIDLEKEDALNLSAGSVNTLEVFDTSVGRIGIAICLDAFRDDIIDVLVEKEADILVQPSANPGPWHEQQQLEWTASSFKRTATEQKFSYAINPMLNGPLWDIAFYGQSSIIGLEELNTNKINYTDLPPELGFLKLAASDYSEEILHIKVPHPTKP